MIKQKIDRIMEEIGDSSLVAVSKSRTENEIKEAILAGIKIIAENKVQEAEKKYGKLRTIFKSENVKFHFIGHLQANKVKKAVAIFDVIQSVDSFGLAELIDTRASEIKKIQEVFIQVNIGHESQKSGASPEVTLELLSRLRKLKNINVSGLMCIPPCSDDHEDSRKYFRQMKHLFDNSGLKSLSMGMTGDYKVALEEGSNMIRIGTGIFGERIKYQQELR